MTRARRHGAVVATVAILALALLALMAGLAGVRVNLTPSLPLGLYVRDPAGELVEFCPAGAASATSAIRGYRARGVCPDGHAPLLKPVVARVGDQVRLTAAGLAVNGHPLPNTRAHRRDHRGRPLRPYPEGTYRVSAQALWVASTWNDGSYDSRYFGPIARSQVRQRLRVLWVLLP